MVIKLSASEVQTVVEQWLDDMQQLAGHVVTDITSAGYYTPELTITLRDQDELARERAELAKLEAEQERRLSSPPEENV